MKQPVARMRIHILSSNAVHSSAERDARRRDTRDAARATDEVGQSRETQPTRCTYGTRVTKILREISRSEKGKR